VRETLARALEQRLATIMGYKLDADSELDGAVGAE